MITLPAVKLSKDSSFPRARMAVHIETGDVKKGGESLLPMTQLHSFRAGTLASVNIKFWLQIELNNFGHKYRQLKLRKEKL